MNTLITPALLLSARHRIDVFEGHLDLWQISFAACNYEPFQSFKRRPRNHTGGFASANPSCSTKMSDSDMIVFSYTSINLRVQIFEGLFSLYSGDVVSLISCASPYVHCLRVVISGF